MRNMWTKIVEFGTRMQKYPSDYILGSTLQTTRVDLRSRRGALAHFPKQQLIVT